MIHDCHQPHCEQPRHQFSQPASHNAANTCKRDVLQRYNDDDHLARSLVPYRFFSLLKEIANNVAPFLPVQLMAFATLTPVIQGLHVLPRFAVAWGFLVVWAKTKTHPLVFPAPSLAAYRFATCVAEVDDFLWPFKIQPENDEHIKDIFRRLAELEKDAKAIQDCKAAQLQTRLTDAQPEIETFTYGRRRQRRRVGVGGEEGEEEEAQEGRILKCFLLW